MSLDTRRGQAAYHPRRPIAQRNRPGEGVIGISLLAFDRPEYRQSTQEPLRASFFITLLRQRNVHCPSRRCPRQSC
jgi:hypothetical protein